MAKESRDWCESLSKQLGGHTATKEPASHELWCEVNDFDGLERLQRSLDDARERVRKMEMAALQRQRQSHEDDNKSIGGTDTDWRTVQNQLLGKRERREPYTSYRKLAKELKCSDSTIRKAIDESELLRGWQARSAGSKAAPKATDLSVVVRDNKPQKAEPAPDDVLPDDEVDALMARLIEQASPSEQGKLRAMNQTQRRAMAAAYQAQNFDEEPSPLDTNAQSKQSRKVKLHKRA
jgi:hypothetical protein